MLPGWFITIALHFTNGTTGCGVSTWIAANFSRHIAKLRKRKAFWQQVGSQAVQDICQRIEKAYQLFFKHHKKGVRPPNFKKVRRYKSFTLKQAGYKFLTGNRIKIGNRVYQYWNSREIEGTVKTLTIKRTILGELFMVVVVDSVDESETKFETGKIALVWFWLENISHLLWWFQDWITAIPQTIPECHPESESSALPETKRFSQPLNEPDWI